MATNRPPYHGTKRKLVLAFDLGTTFSGVSYAILDPGKAPETKTITRYRGQEAGDSKVQTVIYYDKSGKVLAVGAEEPSEGLAEEDSSDYGWEEVEAPIKAEWFKLLLGQRRPVAEDSGVPRTNLPESKRELVDVFADFYAYLYDRAHAFIAETHANGSLLWDSIQGDIDFILTHPNDWGGAQQNVLKRAAAKAGLVPMTPAGLARIQCVTEGEASLHYCISSGLIADAITANENVMIIDAGGGTVDFSTYKITQVAPIALQEIAPTDCIYRGSVMVCHEARNHLQKKLAQSRFGTPAYVDAIATEFDRTTKKRFRGSGDSYVKFSNMTNDRDPQVGVRNGQLRLSAAEVASFFEPSLRDIIAAVDAQLSSAQETVDNIFLVGGFAASEYLFTKLQEHLDIRGHKLSRPDSHVSKAVAEGAISFHIDHFVSTRVAKFTYGAMILAPFLPTRADHQQRAFKKFTHVDGEVCLSDIFDPILRKGTQVSETTEFERKYHQLRRKSKVHTITSTVICYKGNNLPLWMDVQPKQFSNLCTITADVSNVPKYPQKGPLGRYYSQNFSIVLSFGLTELKAHLAWEDKGQKHHGPASIVYDDDGLDLIRPA